MRPSASIRHGKAPHLGGSEGGAFGLRSTRRAELKAQVLALLRRQVPKKSAGGHRDAEPEHGEEKDGCVLLQYGGDEHGLIFRVAAQFVMCNACERFHYATQVVRLIP